MIAMATAPLTCTFLVAIRMGTVFLFSPIEAIRLLPIHVRLLLVLMLSMMVVAHIQLPVLPMDDLALIVSGLSEFCNGLMLSLSLYAAFAVIQIAGQLMDAQMGLNALAIFNPADHTNEPLSSRLLMMLAVLFFFSIDGHHYLIQAWVMSFEMIPPGQLVLLNGFTPVIQQCSGMFSFGLMLASPIVMCLLVVDISSAVLTRNMPQISTYFLVLPIKIMLGLFVFYLLLTPINPLIHQLFAACFQSWTVMMR